MFFLRKSLSRSLKGAGIILILAAALLFSSCSDGGSGGQKTAPSVSVSLNGTWFDEFDHRTINTSAKTIVYENNYKGKIVNSPDYGAKSGVLIIEFTEYTDADYSSYPDVTYTENTENAGKFGALYWNELTDKSVSMADAWIGFVHALFDTLEEAQTNFTIDKTGDYIDWSITSPFRKI